MPRFYFDVFDGSRAVVDEYGDLFTNIEDAAGQAVGIIASYAHGLLPGDGSKDFGVAVRDDGGNDIYRAALAFRDSYSDPARPGSSRNVFTTAPVPDPAAVLKEARDMRREVGETRQLLREMRQRSQASSVLLREARCARAQMALAQAPLASIASRRAA